MYITDPCQFQRSILDKKQITSTLVNLPPFLFNDQIMLLLKHVSNVKKCFPAIYNRSYSSRVSKILLDTDDIIFTD